MVDTKWYYAPHESHGKYVLDYLKRQGYKNSVGYIPSEICCFRGCKDGTIDWLGYRPSDAVELRVENIYELWA